MFQHTEHLLQLEKKYSNIRLTGHDFSDIGTGGISTTNYPDLNGYTQQALTAIRRS